MTAGPYTRGMATYAFSTDPSRLDRARVHRWLSEGAYWALGRSREQVDASIDGSLPYAVHDTETGEQVAFARIVTDGATFAWLCDVFVDPSRRGDGIGKLLVDGVLADVDARGVPRTVLFTADAHGLYEQYGFRVLDDPALAMARRRP